MYLLQEKMHRLWKKEIKNFISLMLLWRKEAGMVRRWKFIPVLKHRWILNFNLNLIDLFCFSILCLFFFFIPPPLLLFLLIFFLFCHLSFTCEEFIIKYFFFFFWSKLITSSRSYYLNLLWRKISSLFFQNRDT